MYGRNQGFSYYFWLLIEVSGSVPRTNVSVLGGPKTFGYVSATLPPSYRMTYGTVLDHIANLLCVQGGGAQSKEDPTEDPEQGVRAGQPETETGIPGQHGGQGQGLHRREPGAQGESETLKLIAGNGSLGGLDSDRNCVPQFFGSESGSSI